MAAPSVWEEEELRPDVADNTPVVGRTPWQPLWVRFRRDKVALAAFAFLILLILAAALAGPITRAVAHPPHALWVALTPIVTIAGLDIGQLLGGAVLTETVFNIPGS